MSLLKKSEATEGVKLHFKRNFYLQDTVTVARALLGQRLCVRENQKILSGIIVETEAYLGLKDPAAHVFHGKITERTKTFYLPGGHAYVYMIYGMYYCFNIVTGDEKTPEAVLIRALMPDAGIEIMRQRRKGRTAKDDRSKSGQAKDSQSKDSRSKDGRLKNSRLKGEQAYMDIAKIASGPGKLCQALGINKTHNGLDLLNSEIYIEKTNEKILPNNIVSKPRIGIDYAGHAVKWPLRFYLKENPCVSSR